MNARFGIECFTSAAAPVQASGDVQIPLHVNRHSVAAAARIKVVKDTHVGNCTINSQVVSADHSRSLLAGIRLNQIQNLVVGRDDEPIGNLNFGRRQNSCYAAVKIDSINATLAGICCRFVAKINSSFSIKCHIIRRNQILPLVLFRKDFSFSALQISACDAWWCARLVSCLAGDQTPLRIKDQAIGVVRGCRNVESFPSALVYDSIVGLICEEDIPIGVYSCPSVKDRVATYVLGYCQRAQGTRKHLREMSNHSILGDFPLTVGTERTASGGKTAFCDVHFISAR